MLSIEVGVLIAIAGAVVSISTFFIGRQSAAKKDGREWGELISDVKHIKEGVDGVKDDVQGVRQELADERRDRKESIKRLHDKWDEHERRISMLEGKQ